MYYLAWLIIKTNVSTHTIDANSQRNLLEANHSPAEVMRASLVNPLSQSGPVTSVLLVERSPSDCFSVTVRL